MNLETQIQRFEQQLDAFEQLHADELKGFEKKLATYMRLQADEVKFLRQELAELQKELAALKEDASSSATLHSQGQPHPRPNQADQAVATLNRREFLGGGAGRHQS